MRTNLSSKASWFRKAQKRSFTEALTVFCGEQKHRDMMRSEMRKRKHNTNTRSGTVWVTHSPVERHRGRVRVQGGLWAGVRAGLSLTVSVWSPQAAGLSACFYKQQTWLRQSDFTAGPSDIWNCFMHTDHDVCLIHSAVRSCTIKRLNTVRICMYECVL